MGLVKPNSLLLVLLLLAIVSASEHATVAESRTLSASPSQDTQQGISKIFSSLGVVCRCCETDGECTSSWKKGSCHKVQCLPWKLS